MLLKDELKDLHNSHMTLHSSLQTEKANHCDLQTECTSLENEIYTLENCPCNSTDESLFPSHSPVRGEGGMNVWYVSSTRYSAIQGSL